MNKRTASQLKEIQEGKQQSDNNSTWKVSNKAQNNGKLIEKNINTNKRAHGMKATEHTECTHHETAAPEHQKVSNRAWNKKAHGRQYTQHSTCKVSSNSREHGRASECTHHETEHDDATASWQAQNNNILTAWINNSKFIERKTRWW
jgi:hypothetical protein